MNEIKERMDGIVVRGGRKYVWASCIGDRPNYFRKFIKDKKWKFKMKESIGMPFIVSRIGTILPCKHNVFGQMY